MDKKLKKKKIIVSKSNYNHERIDIIVKESTLFLQRFLSKKRNNFTSYRSSQNKSKNDVIQIIDLTSADENNKNIDTEDKLDKDNKENNEGNYKIEEITMEEYNKKLIENEKSGDKCIICAKIITSKYFYKCGHLTCNKCALRWIKIKKTCPICRIYLD